MTTTLLSVGELREHIETSLGDAALQAVLDSNAQAITRWAGVLDWDPYEDTVENVTEVLYSAPRERVLKLVREPASVVTVTDRVATTDTVLTVEADDFRISGRHLVRPAGLYWGDRTTVEFGPVNDGATRRMMLIKLCELDLNFQPGMSSQGAGPWTEAYSNYRRQKRELLHVIRPPDAPAMTSVPVVAR